jgi:fatty acid desaturase
MAIMLQELFRRLINLYNWYYAVIMWLVVVMVLLTIVHHHRGVGFEDINEKSNNYHDRTTRRLRAFHGPPLHLRLRAVSSIY